MKLVLPLAWELSVWEDKDYSGISSVSLFFILGKTDCQAKSKYLSTTKHFFFLHFEQHRIRPLCTESLRAATHFFFCHIHEASV